MSSTLSAPHCVLHSLAAKVGPTRLICPPVSTGRRRFQARRVVHRTGLSPAALFLKLFDQSYMIARASVNFGLNLSLGRQRCYNLMFRSPVGSCGIDGVFVSIRGGVGIAVSCPMLNRVKRIANFKLVKLGLSLFRR